MSKDNSRLKIEWKGIAIDISYDPDYSKSFRETYGHRMAHLEIRADGKQRLPITGTGYRSHFTNASLIEERGGPEKFVTGWLEHEAQSKEWKEYFDKSRQMKLF